MHLIEVDLLKEFPCRLKIRIRLTRESHDDVRRDRRILKVFSEDRAALRVLLTGVMAVHAL